MKIIKCFIVFFLSATTTSYAGSIQVAFNQDPRQSYQESYRSIHRQGIDFEQILISAAKSAKRSIWVAVQEFRIPELARELAALKTSGIDVRVVLENKYNFKYAELTPGQIAAMDPHEKSAYDEFIRLADVDHDGVASHSEMLSRDALAILNSSGIPIKDDTGDGTKGSGLMHHKFMIVDGERVISTTANFTTSDMFGDLGAPLSRGNPNSLVDIDDINVARAFMREFEILWGQNGKPIFGLKKPFRGVQTFKVGNTEISIQFSPTSKTRGWDKSTNGLIERTLLKAQNKIDFALFVFSEQKLANAMHSFVRRHGTLRGLVEADFAFRYYSELLDIWGIQLRDPKCRSEAGNSPWPEALQSVGTPSLPHGDRLHHKFAVLDGGQNNGVVIVGSHNWSKAANEQNDETLFVIKDPEIANAFEAEYERLQSTAYFGVPAWLTKKVADTSKKCGL